MDVKQLVLEFQYSEKIKSQLIIGSNLLAHVEALKGEEKAGGEKIVKTYLHALLGEIRIALNSVKSINYHGAEKHVTQGIDSLQKKDLHDSNLRISKALSYITTSCQAAMTNLQERDLL